MADTLPPYDPARSRRTLFSALADARAQFGRSRAIVTDGDERTLTYEELVRATLALGHALKAGTINAAFTLGMESEIGTLEEGKLADILVVDGDPLADIQVLQDKARLKVIMKGGQVIDTETPLPKPTIYPWEKPMLYWTDPRQPDQEYVRAHAGTKPDWMRKQESSRRAAE